MVSPEALRTYAEIFEMPRKVHDPVLKRMVLRMPTEMQLAASAALRFQADVIDTGEKMRLAALEAFEGQRRIEARTEELAIRQTERPL